MSPVSQQRPLCRPYAVPMPSFINSSPEKQKNLLKEPGFLELYQAGFIGFQYNCRQCLAERLR